MRVRETGVDIKLTLSSTPAKGKLIQSHRIYSIRTFIKHLFCANTKTITVAPMSNSFERVYICVC